MRQIVVVGSGASAVHFALSALEKGHEVLMLDVGREAEAPVLPDATFAQLKSRLPNPTDYFLGNRFEAVMFPGNRSEYYGFPPSKNYVFEGVAPARVQADGFSPLSSFARGGLAEAWTGGSYPFNDAELAEFPFKYRDIEPYYDRIAERIGIAGAADDLARFMPLHRNLMPPLELDEHSAALLRKYELRRGVLNARFGCYVGRSRIAVLSRDVNGRRGCEYLGRCLWGCPNRSLYTPSITLDECRRYDRFRYVAGAFVRSFRIDRGRAVSVVVESTANGSTEEVPIEDSLALGAGTLSSSRIFLESMLRSTGQRLTLEGLMDNQQILMPFVNLAMLTRRYNPDSYQYHQLGFGVENGEPASYIHAQVTTLKTALIHPIVQSLPLDLRTSLALFGDVHGALGIVNVNLHDTRRPANRITLEPSKNGVPGRLMVRYETGATEEARIRAAIKKVKRILWQLGCIVPPGMTHVRPMGASVHYAGVIPMSSRRDPHTSSAVGQSHDVENLYFVDGTTFPFLPAKNITFTLMANAARIADVAF